MSEVCSNNGEGGACVERTEQPPRSPLSVGLLLYAATWLIIELQAPTAEQEGRDRTFTLAGLKNKFPDRHLSRQLRPASREALSSIRRKQVLILKAGLKGQGFAHQLENSREETGSVSNPPCFVL